MRAQFLIVLIFAVFCFSQMINADSEQNSFESRDIDGARRIKEVGLLERLIKAVVDLIERILGTFDPKDNSFGILSRIVTIVIELLNEILPESIELSIISIKILKNIIVIEIGKTDSNAPIPQPPPTKPEPIPTVPYQSNFPFYSPYLNHNPVY